MSISASPRTVSYIPVPELDASAYDHQDSLLTPRMAHAIRGSLESFADYVAEALLDGDDERLADQFCDMPDIVVAAAADKEWAWMMARAAASLATIVATGQADGELAIRCMAQQVLFEETYRKFRYYDGEREDAYDSAEFDGVPAHPDDDDMDRWDIARDDILADHDHLFIYSAGPLSALADLDTDISLDNWFEPFWCFEDPFDTFPPR
jgi:hypothetical protein